MIQLSRYTTTINDIINHYLPDEIRYTDFSLNTLVERTHKQFFNFEYDFYCDDSKVKDKFEQDFLLTYLNDYIGYETLGMFRARLLSHLNTNMYWYTRMYERIIQGDDPFINQSEKIGDSRILNVGENEEKQQNANSHTQTNSQTQTNDTTNTNSSTKTNETTKNDSESIHSDNPQVTIKTHDYASTMDRATEKGSTTENGTGKTKTVQNVQTTSKGVSDSTQKVNDKRDRKEKEEEEKENVRTGLTGISRADAIQKYSEQIFNLEKMLIDSCKGMFLKVW